MATPLTPAALKSRREIEIKRAARLIDELESVLMGINFAEHSTSAASARHHVSMAAREITYVKLSLIASKSASS